MFSLNGFVKEKIVLGYIADFTHELSKWDATNILPAKVDRTGGYIPKPAISLAIVDFPEPDGPTMAVMVPGCVWNEIPWRISASL